MKTGGRARNMIRRAKNCSLRYPVTGNNRSVHDQVSRNGWGPVQLFGDWPTGCRLARMLVSNLARLRQICTENCALRQLSWISRMLVCSLERAFAKVAPNEFCLIYVHSASRISRQIVRQKGCRKGSKFCVVFCCTPLKNTLRDLLRLLAAWL
jgi:hypothetical protein